MPADRQEHPPTSPPSTSVEALTRVLERAGREGRLGGVFPLVYEELQRVAAARFRSERPNHTLQATALVHEAFLRLADSRQRFVGRKHFYGAASEAMRRVLVDHARRAGASRRGGSWRRVSLAGVEAGGPPADSDSVLGLDEALRRLERLDERAAEVARLRLFGGLSIEAVAEVLEVSTSTVQREWRYARARMRQALDAREAS